MEGVYPEKSLFEFIQLVVMTAVVLKPMKTSFIAAVAISGCLAVSALIEAQRAPPTVDFRPVSNSQNWIVKEPLIYEVGISHDSVTVPRGFVTDFATIPPILQSLIQQNGPHLLPAVIHDYLYWKQSCTRDQADQIFLLAMMENKVSTTERTAMYQAVRAAGELAWTSNARERAAGLIRILPENRLQVPTLTTWPDYRQGLLKMAVADGPSATIAAAFCQRGSMSIEQALQTP